MKAIVVAYDHAHGIGAANDLLWQRNLPADLAHFKTVTTGGTIVMGRKTYESIGRPLPNRQNIVVSRSGFHAAGVLSVDSLQAAYQAAEHPIFVIGGGEIFAQALPAVDTVYATEVDATFPEASVFFPVLGPEWQEVSREHHEKDDKNLYNYDFVTYQRA
ncbi:MAG TPA: dihydrofolate reductase [Candidatus Microsaccharimonas sp.]|nr:dihydrofolate reductase [Candidatus Microsaccharimonas sp.]